ncbi:MAG: hypothetical protein M9942_11850 [Microthrixaceae bacterium]|nr:hypothetical protein [Microthrixaceae bacterium]MCO5319118.1 hypothetical protein [Microthrixaceae bacterium]
MNRTRRRTRTVLLGAVAALALVAAACVPEPAPANTTWEFKATKVTVNDVQDEVCVIVCVNRADEPYVMNIATRVKIGVPNSASGFVVSSRSNNPEGLEAGESATLSGAAGAPVSFPGISRLDVADLLNQDNKLEVFVVYTWVMEEDTVAVNTAANDVKDLLVDALNSTLAQGSLPSDASALLDLIFDNLGNAFTLLLSNIPLFGLGDDVGGGALNVGIAAKGGLADVVDASIGTADIPEFNVPVVSLPPDVKHVNIFTMKNTTTFTGQSFDQYGDGEHTYDFQANQG